MTRHEHRFDVMMDDEFMEIFDRGARDANLTSSEFFRRAVCYYAHIKAQEKQGGKIMVQEANGTLKQIVES